MADLRAFADHLWLDRDLDFQIDTPFDQYTDDDGHRLFTDEEVALYDRLMSECILLCEQEQVDVYELFHLLEFMD